MAFLLITRPLDEAVEMEKDLTLPLLKAPLLEVEVLPPSAPIRLNSYTSLIVTSSRSLAVFPDCASFLKKPIWCVGEKTALKAKNLGFETIYTADNSAENLYHLILSKTVPGQERFLHICGQHLHFDIVEKLKEQGYEAEKLVLYKTHPVSQFPSEILKAFSAQEITLAPVYSRRTAQTFADLIEKHALKDSLKNITLVVYAPHIAEPLQQYKWRQIIIQSDLSSAALKKLYHIMHNKQPERMSLKTFWPWGVVSIVTSTFFSLGVLLVVASRFFTAPSVDVAALQQTVEGNLKQQQAAPLEAVHKQLNEIAGHVDSLKNQLQSHINQTNQEIETIKNQSPGALSSAPSLPLTYQAYTLLSLLEAELNYGHPHPTLWQEIIKILQQLSIALPPSLQEMKDLPESKESLIQEVKKLNIPVVISSENTPSFTHRWLNKIEQYIGQIIITKDAASSVTAPAARPAPDSSLLQQIIQVIEQEDLTELNKWKERKDLPPSLTPFIEKACIRGTFLDGIREVKGTVLALWNQGKE